MLAEPFDWETHTDSVKRLGIDPNDLGVMQKPGKTLPSFISAPRSVGKTGFLDR